MNRAEVEWDSSVFRLDRLSVPIAMLAAYTVSLKHLPHRSRPNWLISSNSDGRNLFGREIVGKGSVVGWVGGRIVRRDLKSPEGFRNAAAFPPRVVRQVAGKLEHELQSQLYNSAYVPLMDRASRLCRPELAYHDHMFGPQRGEVIKALVELHGTPKLFEEVHQAVMSARVTLLSKPIRLASDIAIASREFAGCHRGPSSPHFETIAFSRPFCDTVYSIAVPPIGMEEFATVCYILKGLTTEFRRALCRRGGIYAAGLHVSFVKRTVSWWTHLDHDPVSTYWLARTLPELSRTLHCFPDCPDQTLAYLPPRPPKWPGEATAQALMWIWGLRGEDWEELPRAEQRDVNVAQWLGATGQCAFCACGPARKLEALRPDAVAAAELG